MTTLEELEKIYTTNRYGIITDSGKFEGETLATPFYYDLMLDGEGEVIEVQPSDRWAFDLEDSDNFVLVCVSNDGFVTLQWYETREAAENDALKEYEIEDDNIECPVCGEIDYCICD